VDAILVASEELLERHGYRALTTNAVAERAGVSIGTLYQYFRSKDALVGAVMDRHCQAIERAVCGVFIASAEMGATMSASIAATVRVHEHRPRLHHVLMEQVPIVGPRDARLALERAIQDKVTDWLAARVDLATARALALVLRTTIEQVVHEALHAPEERERALLLLELMTRAAVDHAIHSSSVTRSSVSGADETSKAAVAKDGGPNMPTRAPREKATGSAGTPKIPRARRSSPSRS
jgi:AcrR family transcriptional regulator